MFWNLIQPSINSFFLPFRSGIAITNASFLYWIFVTLGLLMSISIHEFAHAYSAHVLGDDTAKNNDRMNINPFKHFDVFGLFLILFTFFGYGKPVPVNPANFRDPAKGMMLVSLAGPASNFVLAFLCGIIYLALKPFVSIEGSFGSIQGILIGFASTFVYSLGIIGLLNLGLMVFNLIPVFPLDGRKIFGYIHYSIDDFFMKYVDPYGIWVVIFLIFPLIPIGGGVSIAQLISYPFFIIYTLAFGVRL